MIFDSPHGRLSVVCEEQIVRSAAARALQTRSRIALALLCTASRLLSRSGALPLSALLAQSEPEVTMMAFTANNGLQYYI